MGQLSSSTGCFVNHGGIMEGALVGRVTTGVVRGLGVPAPSRRGRQSDGLPQVGWGTWYMEGSFLEKRKDAGSAGCKFQTCANNDCHTVLSHPVTMGPALCRKQGHSPLELLGKAVVAASTSPASRNESKSLPAGLLESILASLQFTKQRR